MVDLFICPITHENFVDPITMICCGQTFSRSPVQNTSNRCPMCNHSIDINTKNTNYWLFNG